MHEIEMCERAYDLLWKSPVQLLTVNGNVSRSESMATALRCKWKTPDSGNKCYY